MKSFIAALSMFLVSALSGQERPDFFTATFNDILLDISDLRIKKEVQTMIPLFCKGGFAASTTVYTEGDGKLYLLIFRGNTLAQVGSLENFEEDQLELYEAAGIKPEHRPIIDRANRRIEYFTEASWNRILKSMSDYPMDEKFIDIFVQRTNAQNAPDVCYLIPPGKEKHLLESLVMKGWGIDPNETRFFVPPKEIKKQNNKPSN